MAPRFSILLPTRNRPELLALAIASVLSQTEGNFELLVVGDGCTDDTAAVVAGFGDARIRWFGLPKAPGFGYANRNVALRQAAGDYIAFVADDDLLFPDHLARLAATLEQSGAEWAYNRPLWVTTDGIVVPYANNLQNADELETFLTLRNDIPATCVLYRRSCLDAYGYWPEDVPSSGDWRYWIRIIEGGGRTRLAYSPVPGALHFNALWKTTPDTQAGQVIVAGEIARSGSWWPACLKVPMTPGIPEQKIFFDLIGSPGYVERLRRDVSLVLERLAWMQLCDAYRLEETQARLVEVQARLEEAQGRLEEAQARLEKAQARLDAVRASASWRLTTPLRAVSRAIRRSRRRTSRRRPS